MAAVALVGRVTDVQPHPDNDELRTKMDVVTISGKTNVATRPTPDQPRYQIGDLAVMLPENTILPDWLIKHLDLWDETKGKGMLGGKAGNRLGVRAIGTQHKIRSEVALCSFDSTVYTEPVALNYKHEFRISFDNETYALYIQTTRDQNMPDLAGKDFTSFMGITHIYDPVGKTEVRLALSPEQWATEHAEAIQALAQASGHMTEDVVPILEKLEQAGWYLTKPRD